MNSSFKFYLLCDSVENKIICPSRLLLTVMSTLSDSSLKMVQNQRPGIVQVFQLKKNIIYNLITWN